MDAAIDVVPHAIKPRVQRPACRVPQPSGDPARVAEPFAVVDVDTPVRCDGRFALLLRLAAPVFGAFSSHTPYGARSARTASIVSASAADLSGR